MDKLHELLTLLSSKGWTVKAALQNGFAEGTVRLFPPQKTGRICIEITFNNPALIAQAIIMFVRNWNSVSIAKRFNASAAEVEVAKRHFVWLANLLYCQQHQNTLVVLKNMATNLIGAIASLPPGSNTAEVLKRQYEAIEDAITCIEHPFL